MSSKYSAIVAASAPLPLLALYSIIHTFLVTEDPHAAHAAANAANLQRLHLASRSGASVAALSPVTEESLQSHAPTTPTQLKPSEQSRLYRLASHRGVAHERDAPLWVAPRGGAVGGFVRSAEGGATDSGGYGGTGGRRRHPAPPRPAAAEEFPPDPPAVCSSPDDPCRCTPTGRGPGVHGRHGGCGSHNAEVAGGGKPSTWAVHFCYVASAAACLERNASASERSHHYGRAWRWRECDMATEDDCERDAMMVVHRQKIARCAERRCAAHLRACLAAPTKCRNGGRQAATSSGVNESAAAAEAATYERLQGCIMRSCTDASQIDADGPGDAKGGGAASGGGSEGGGGGAAAKKVETLSAEELKLLDAAVARVRRGEEPTAVLMAMKEELQKAGGGAEPSVGKVEAAGKKFLQDAPLPPAKRAELKKMLDDYLMMQSVLAG